MAAGRAWPASSPLARTPPARSPLSRSPLSRPPLSRSPPSRVPLPLPPRASASRLVAPPTVPDAASAPSAPAPSSALGWRLAGRWSAAAPAAGCGAGSRTACQSYRGKGNAVNADFSEVPGFMKHSEDTGGTEVQIARLTARIGQLGRHLSLHWHDRSCLRGRDLLLARRTKLLAYLRRTDPGSYLGVVADLNIHIPCPRDNYGRLARERRVGAPARELLPLPKNRARQRGRRTGAKEGRLVLTSVPEALADQRRVRARDTRPRNLEEAEPIYERLRVQLRFERDERRAAAEAAEAARLREVEERRAEEKRRTEIRRIIGI